MAGLLGQRLSMKTVVENTAQEPHHKRGAYAPVGPTNQIHSRLYAIKIDDRKLALVTFEISTDGHISGVRSGFWRRSASR